MAEELSSPNHYVACTGDYDCAADEHIEGCGIVDKRAADEQQHDPHDAAERDLVEFLRRHRDVLSDFDVCFTNDREFVGWHEDGLIISVFDVAGGSDTDLARRINLDG